MVSKGILIVKFVASVRTDVNVTSIRQLFARTFRVSSRVLGSGEGVFMFVASRYFVIGGCWDVSKAATSAIFCV